MTQSPLHGLNIVHPRNHEHAYSSDSQDLLTAPPFPDLAAQLDLWTNLTFQSDEPLGKRFDGGVEKSERYNDREEDGEGDGEDEGTARIDGHTNVITPQVVSSTPAPQSLGHNGSSSDHAQQHVQQQAIDFNAVLAGFGIDPYLVPQVPNPALVSPIHQNPAASLVQLLAAYPAAAASLAPNFGLGLPQPGYWGQTPLLSQAQVPVQQRAAPDPASSLNTTSPPVSKKARTRKASISPGSPTTNSSSNATSPATSSVGNSATSSSISSSASSLPSVSADTTTPLTATEDKRRRNTAASARFRLKKKEREAALESRSKELEVRVTELERECEALRRENGWLKGLVVGVTGGNGVGTPPPGESGTKRKRDAGAAKESDKDALPSNQSSSVKVDAKQ